MTFYDILGVPFDATLVEIRFAYRELARQHHPDGQQAGDEEAAAESEEITKALNAAYDTLSNPVRRRAYSHIMHTRLDPARNYSFKAPNAKSKTLDMPGRRSKKGKDDARRAASSSSILSEIKHTRFELQQMLEQQQLKRQSFWMVAAFTSLLMYFLIALGLLLFPTPYDLFPLLILFIGGELISQTIIMNSGGMQIDRFPFRGNPVTFSITVFMGTLLSSVTLSAQGFQFSRPDGLYFGLVMSLVLILHLFLITRMGNLQDTIFSEEIRHLDEHIEYLEKKLRDVKNKSNF